MRVLFVVHRMHPNLREVEYALTSSGHHCTFVVTSIGASEPEFFSNRILVSPSSASREFVSQFFDKEVPDLLIQRRFDGPYLAFWKIARERKIARLLYTQDPHEAPLLDAFVRPFRVLRLLRDLVKQRIVLGPHTRITPVRFWGRKGGFTFSNSEYLPFPAVIKYIVKPSEPDLLTVLTVAKHGQTRKRVMWLLRALKQASTPFKLIIVGSRPSPSHRRRQANYSRFLRSILKLGERAGNVVVHENLDREAMEALYNASNIFALPSKRELMAISPLEAMSHGLPVLASSDGGAASYLFPVGSEQIFRARSYRDFRKKLIRLLEDEGLRKKLSARAIKHLELTHSPEAFVDRLAELTHTKTGS